MSGESWLCYSQALGDVLSCYSQDMLSTCSYSLCLAMDYTVHVVLSNTLSLSHSSSSM